MEIRALRVLGGSHSPGVDSAWLIIRSPRTGALRDRGRRRRRCGERDRHGGGRRPDRDERRDPVGTVTVGDAPVQSRADLIRPTRVSASRRVVAAACASCRPVARRCRRARRRLRRCPGPYGFRCCRRCLFVDTGDGGRQLTMVGSAVRSVVAVGVRSRAGVRVTVRSTVEAGVAPTGGSRRCVGRRVDPRGGLDFRERLGVGVRPRLCLLFDFAARRRRSAPLRRAPGRRGDGDRRRDVGRRS